jgi:hypothetical protein
MGFVWCVVEVPWESASVVGGRLVFLSVVVDCLRCSVVLEEQDVGVFTSCWLSVVTEIDVSFWRAVLCNLATWLNT